MNGLQHRYNVERVSDLEGKHTDCRYFVLDPQHDPFAKQALNFYANIVAKTEPELARDLEMWMDSL